MNNQIKTLCDTIFNKLVYIDKKYPDVIDLNQYTDLPDCVLSSDLCLVNMYYTDSNFDIIIKYFTELLIRSRNERVYFETIREINIDIKTEYIKNILEYQIQFIEDWDPYVTFIKNNN